MKQLIILWQTSVGFNEMSKRQKRQALILGALYTGILFTFLINYFLGLILVVISMFLSRDKIPVRE